MPYLFYISGSSPVKSPVDMREPKEQLSPNTVFKLQSLEPTSQYNGLTFRNLSNSLEKYLLKISTTDGLVVGKLWPLLKCIVTRNSSNS